MMYDAWNGNAIKANHNKFKYYKQPLQDFLAAVGARNKEKVKKDVTVVAIIF